jgi:5-formyltetrahydrofolate cyclo-ligase
VDVAAEKRDLRIRMRRLRGSIPPQERERLGGLIAERLLALDALATARTVLVYDSFGSEVPTRIVLEGLRRRGAGLLLPYLEGDRMEAAEAGALEDLRESGYGPREPATKLPVDPREVEAVLVPGLAFDGAGRRLGYGGGSFDRYLERLPEAATRIGLAFGVQLLDEVPADEGDETVDMVVTEHGVVDCRSARGPSV